MLPLSSRAAVCSFHTRVNPTRGSSFQPSIRPLPFGGAGWVLLAGTVAAAAYVCLRSDDEPEKISTPIKQIPVLSLPPPSLKKDSERRLIAMSVAQSENTLLRNLIYNFIRSNSYEVEEVSQFLFEYVKELHQPNAHPDAKGSVGKWLYALKCCSRSDFNALLTKLHNEKYVPNLFVDPKFRSSHESDRIMDELYSDYKELKLK